MATITAKSPFDLDTANLNIFVREMYDSGFHNNVDVEYEGQTYSDVMEINSEIDGYYYAVVFFGSSISYSDAQGMTSGTITAFVNSVWTGADWFDYVTVTGVSISAKAMWKAGQTATTADEIALFRAELQGDDRFNLSDYEDRANGFAGNDRLFGKGGEDILRGGQGNDLVSGGGGDDRLIGEAGRDELRGGAGSDTLVFWKVSDSGRTAGTADLIVNFQQGLDKIELQAIDAFASTKANDEFVWNGKAGFSSGAMGEVRYKKVDNAGTDNDYTLVLIDNDRDSGAEMAIRLTGLHDLTAADFIL